LSTHLIALIPSTLVYCWPCQE